jgi:hypothetical protein
MNNNNTMTKYTQREREDIYAEKQSIYTENTNRREEEK